MGVFTSLPQIQSNTSGSEIMPSAEPCIYIFISSVIFDLLSYKED